jgi:hypothetical protein
MADDRIEIVFAGDIQELSAAVQAVRDQIGSLSAPLKQASDHFGASASAMAMQWQETQSRLADISLESEKTWLDAEVQAGTISNAEKLAALRQYTDQAYELKRQSLEQEMALDNLSVQAKLRIYDELLLLDAKHQQQILQQDVEAQKATQQAWQGTLGIIDQSLDTMLRGVLQGTQTWQQAMDRLFENLAASFIENIAKMMVQWAAFEAGIASNPLSGGALGSILGGIGGLFGGGAFVDTAGMGSGDLAAAGALAFFDTGAWNVPRDMIAMIHQGEMVLPPDVAAMARGGGASPFPSGSTASTGGGQVINVSFAPQVVALDGKSAVAALNEPGTMRQLATNLGKYLAMNPSVRGAY